ncbi:hypothetical protein [Pacificoceanicola onchidii]|uniref:hypothetical protein n=1 Tax=Pacificoceanicola onchidii TaxID=2562685 RepID=UPI0014560799|nr:hypothetical protein [Pacificoceanicola onchidii]
MSLPKAFETKRKNYAAKCPHCGDPHHYTELKFPMVNDRGTWVIKCNACSETFAVDLKNPIESPAGNCRVIERYDDEEDPYAGSVEYATDRAVYRLAINDEDPVFDFNVHPIYCCAETDEGLEKAALAELVAAIGDIRQQWGIILNNYLARRMPEVEHLLVSIKVPCSCSQTHVATFYRPFQIDPNASLELDGFLLADVSGVNLADVLSGIHTKSYLMDALDKLIVRWRLYKDQVLIAAPFVGHQWKSKSEKLEIWERLLKQLDAKRTVFLTRSATWSGYKSALQETGLDHDVLASYGLENQIVATGNKKQDFHAKVYIGIGDQCEVFSGSANLVDGPSMENASFAVSPYNKVIKKYVDPLKLSLPAAPERANHHLMIRLTGVGWIGSLQDGPAPELS